MDQTLQLPVLGSARPLEWKGEFEPLVLNIDQDGHIKVYGVVVDPEKHIAREAAELKAQLQAAGKPTSGELPVPVVMRSDKGTKFHLINRVIQLCQENGYQQFSLSAMSGKGDQ